MAVLLKTALVRVSSIQIMQIRVQNKGKRVWKSRYIGDVSVTSRTAGVPYLVWALRNERLPKDFKGPRKVPNYIADLPPKAWIESYEMALELLEVSNTACAKYFTMMPDGTTRTWL